MTSRCAMPRPEEYLLNKKEAENIIDRLQDELTGNVLKDMFASSNREKFAKNMLKPLIKKEVKKRKVIKLPSDVQMINGLCVVLEELSS